MNSLLVGLMLLLLGGCCSLFSYRLRWLMQPLYQGLTVTGSLAGIFAVYRMFNGLEPLSFSCSWLQVLQLSFSFDSLSGLFLLLVFLLSPCIALYGMGYQQNASSGLRVAISHFCCNLLTVAMAILLVADNTIAFALAWELMSLASYFLVIYDYSKKETQRAGYLYLLFTQSGALLIFAAFGLLGYSAGGFAFDQFSQAAPAIQLTTFFLTLVGFGSKAGIVPLHIWLPHAHPAAPSHVSALMSGVMIKMGVYGILRMYLLLDDLNPLMPQAILLCGIGSGVLGVIYALGQSEYKRMLAYSSIENIGIILIGLGLGMLGLSSGNQLMALFGFAGGLLHMLNHAFFKSLLFMGAGAVLQATGIRQMDQLGGLMKNMPVTGRTFLAGSAAISGLPPLNGFVSEFFIYYAAFLGLSLSGYAFFYSLFAILALAVIGGLAIGCFTKALGIIFLGEARSEQARKARESNWAIQVPMVLLAGLCLLVGIFPGPFLQLILTGLRDVSQLTPFSPDLLGSLPDHLAMALRLFWAFLLGVFLLRRFLYHRKPVSQSGTWGCGFTQATPRIQYTGTSYSLSMVRFHEPFIKVRVKLPSMSSVFPSRINYESKVEDLAEIGLYSALLRSVFWGINKLHWIQHGRIQLYIAYIIATIAVLLLTL